MSIISYYTLHYSQIRIRCGPNACQLVYTHIIWSSDFADLDSMGTGFLTVPDRLLYPGPQRTVTIMVILKFLVYIAPYITVPDHLDLVPSVLYLTGAPKMKENLSSH